MLAALVAFGLITLDIYDARKFGYQALNLSSGIALAYYSIVKTAWANI